jgi:cyclopropane-fatty-acyl-phospholipid synthase
MKRRGAAAHSPAPQRSGVAAILAPAIERILGGSPPVRIRFWDGTSVGRETPTTLVINSPRALRRLLWAPNELGLSRAYVAGEIEVEGDIFAAFQLRDAFADADDDARISFGVAARLRVVQAAARLGALGFPPPAPPEEARLRGRMHSRVRDRRAISHHYDVSNEFYGLVLGRTMTYSCAYFETLGTGLDDAQRAKYDLICRKLGLSPGRRLLDVGCGWGGMVMHAAKHYGVEAVGVTLSEKQHDLASKQVAESGLADRVEIRLQDYRDVHDGPYDAISSIGMFEHVGVSQLGRYFDVLRGLLTPGGRLLNHAVSRPPGRSRFDRSSFISRYVFPDGELQEVGSVASAMQAHGFEVRDVESLREHYALTLRAWVANLERNWHEAVALAGLNRARIWRLYMAGSAVGFEAARINVHQVLGVVPADGASGMPLTRAGLLHELTTRRLVPFKPG